MATGSSRSDRAETGGIDPDLLRPSGALLAANIALAAAIDQAVADVGQPPVVLDLLTRLELAPDGQLRAVELCRQLLKSPSHISRTIDRAEQAGLVERRPDPDDRRAHLVVLTTEGRELARRFAPRVHHVLDEVIHGQLDRAEIDTLVELCERIEAAARALDE